MNTGIPTLNTMIVTGGAWIVAQVPAIEAGGPWISAWRDLGSFGLVAFIVWWYATHVAPNSEKRFLEALSQQRVDYLAAQQTQRTDYLAARVEDHTELRKLAEVMETLAKSNNELSLITGTHIGEARAVWTARGELPRKPASPPPSA